MVMPRGRLQLRRIEDQASRQVTFSKRRAGLFKKAHELAVLCDAELGLIVFSDKGKLYEFSSGPSMGRIIKRHQQFSEAERAGNLGGHEAQSHAKGSTSSRTNSELLEIAQRPFDKPNLAQLGVNELEQIEEELDEALRETRSRKEQQMTSMIAKLHEKANTLLEERRCLESLSSGVVQEAASVERGKEAGRQDDSNEIDVQAGNTSLGLRLPPVQALHLLVDRLDP